MSVWAPVQYGWGVVYALTIEGVPVVFVERETSLTLPAGYAQDASLVIDRSSEVGQLVDRETGLGAGYPLTLQLLDTVEVRSWLRKWGAAASLTANVAWNDATISVDDTTGWVAPGVLWLGIERVAYNGKTANSFTGCTRATAGSLASSHVAGTIGGIATDLPRWWRGRQVRLYALPVTPSGTMTGTALLDEADEIWRGTIDNGPDRAGMLWELQAQSLDRRLDLTLAAEVTGSIVDTVARYPCEPGHSLAIHVAGFTAAAPAVKSWEFYIVCYPFAAVTSGDLLTPAQQADAIKSAWTAALALAPNIVTGLFNAATFIGALTVKSNGPQSMWYLKLQAACVPIGGVVSSKVVANGAKTTAGDTFVAKFWQSVVAGQELILAWWSNGHHLVGASAPGTLSLVPMPLTGVCVEFDSPSPNLPQSGRLRIGDNTEVTYSKLQLSGTLGFFAGLYQNGVNPAALGDLAKGDPVAVVFTVGGTAQDVQRKLLSSSGTAQRGVYDTLALGNGYGLDGTTAATSAINLASFDNMAAGPLVALPVEVATAGRTFAQCFGGLLALSQRGVVARGDDLLGARRQRLALVSTEPGGSEYVTTITDQHLLTSNDDSVQAVAKRDVPNTIRILVPQGAENPNVFQVQDGPAAAYQGAVVVEYDLPVFGKVTTEQATQWALARFGPAQTEQAIELRLVPWLDFDVGDLVRLELTHYSIWQWSTGTPGYTGNGRVLGVRRDLKLGAVVATILIDGTTSKLALCPAMQVTLWTGAAGAPATIDVPLLFKSHLDKAIAAAAGPVDLLHYEAGKGAEGAGGGYTIRATATFGSACRLTIAATLGGAVLTASSWLTLPRLPTCSDYQAGFAHVDDGSNWG